MRFQNVDHKKCDFALVVVIQLVESGNLPPEGRSSVAAKDENHRLVRGEGRELNAVALVQFKQ